MTWLKSNKQKWQKNARRGQLLIAASSKASEAHVRLGCSPKDRSQCSQSLEGSCVVQSRRLSVLITGLPACNPVVLYLLAERSFVCFSRGVLLPR